MKNALIFLSIGMFLSASLALAASKEQDEKRTGYANSLTNMALGAQAFGLECRLVHGLRYLGYNAQGRNFKLAYLSMYVGTIIGLRAAIQYYLNDKIGAPSSFAWPLAESALGYVSTQIAYNQFQQ